MKWPVQWIRAITNSACDAFRSTDTDHDERCAAAILDSLSEVDALRDIPKPKERWECVACGKSFSTDPQLFPLAINVACPMNFNRAHPEWLYFVETKK